MMTKYGFSLRAVNSFGSSINLGLWVAFTMGFFYDKYGPKFSCILGAFLLCGSYVVLYFILTSSIGNINIVFFLIIGLLMGQGSALCYTTAITTNLKNFKIKETSIIVGLLVANMAISPSIFTTYKEYLENVNIENYFLLISIFLGIIITICGILFTNIKDVYSNESKLMDYQKYKEKNVIFLLLILNFITLIIYIFGVMLNYSNSNSRFPNFIVYPCLQSLNFVFLILEKLKVFDHFYFREFISKEIKKKIYLEDENYRNEIRLRKLNVEKNAIDNLQNIKEENPISEINKGNHHSDKNNTLNNFNNNDNLDKEKPFYININEINLNEIQKEEDIIKENNNDVNSDKSISNTNAFSNTNQFQQPKQSKIYKTSDKNKTARNFNLDVKNELSLQHQTNLNNFSVDYKYEKLNKNKLDINTHGYNQFDDFTEKKAKEENKLDYNRKMNTTVGEVFHPKNLYLEKLENNNSTNLKIHNTNSNQNNMVESNQSNRLSNAIFENFKIQKNIDNKFEILDEESKEDSLPHQNRIVNNDNSLDYKNKELIEDNYGNVGLEISDKIENNKVAQNHILHNNIHIDDNNNSSENLQNNSLSIIKIGDETPNESEYRRFVKLVTSKEVSILFIILVFGVGSVIGNLNNIEFIISTISKTTSRSDIFEYSILYFSFNSLSRLASGIIIDKLILEGNIFIFLLATSLFGLFSQILGILMIKEFLIFSICLSGSVHGGLLTFAPIYTKNFFDIKDMGKILGFLTTGAALGSVFIGNLIFTIFYEVFKVDDVCKGQRCFRYSFVITSFLFIVNICLSIYLMRIMSKRLNRLKRKIEKKDDEEAKNNKIEINLNNKISEDI